MHHTVLSRLTCWNRHHQLCRAPSLACKNHTCLALSTDSMIQTEFGQMQDLLQLVGSKYASYWSKISTDSERRLGPYEAETLWFTHPMHHYVLGYSSFCLMCQEIQLTWGPPPRELLCSQKSGTSSPFCHSFLLPASASDGVSEDSAFCPSSPWGKANSHPKCWGSHLETINTRD